VAVVDCADRQLTLAGPALGVDSLGGEDFDVRLLAAVLDDLGHPELHALATGSAQDQAAYLELRRSCREAKETLSSQIRAQVRVPPVPGVFPTGTSVQVSRPHRLEPLLLADPPGVGLPPIGPRPTR
jgi:molecular chaperone DnaK (HSP70)